MLRKANYILWLSEVDKTDIGLVGGEGARLAEMEQAGLPLAEGFIVSTKAYFAFLRENKLLDKIHDLLSTANFEHADSLMQISAHIRKLMIHGSMSEELVKEIFFGYRKLSGIFRDAMVQVYFSPTENISNGIASPDLIGIAMTGVKGISSPVQRGRNDTNCKGEANLILKIKEGWASFFEPKAIIYRHEKNLGHFRQGMAIIVQRMVKPDCSGLIFTQDPVTNDKSKIVIEAIYGEGELLAGGHITPDRYELEKADLEVISKIVVNQTVLLKKDGSKSKKARIPGYLGRRQKLTQKQISELALLGKKLEKHYYFPKEIEWAIEKKKIFITQTRNINGLGVGQKGNGIASSPDLIGILATTSRLQMLLKGVPGSPGIATGRVKIVTNTKELEDVDNGDILVAEQIKPDYKRVLKKAAAIITDHGGRTSHGAIAARDIGIPAVAGTEKASKILRNGMIVTVNGSLGEVYKGGYAKQDYFKTATQVYADIENSALAQKVAQKNADGVGPLRVEAIEFEAKGEGDIYSERLAEQIGFFCLEFAGRPVVYRPRDFEELELELEAIKIVRQKLGYKNIWVMVPFCRTVKELIEVKRIMSLSGLHRSPTFKLWMTVEVPSNIILIDKFVEVGIDGVSIGLNNLATLVLGIDRDDSEVGRAFDSRDPAVLWAIERTIKSCHKYGISSSIYGQDVSMDPNLVEKLVEWGISSVSVAPDVIERTREKIFNIERRLIEKRHHGKN